MILSTVVLAAAATASGRLPGPDARLDVAGAQDAVHLNLQLTDACVIAAERGPEQRVDTEGELGSRVIDEQQLRAVLAQPHEGEVCAMLSVCSLPMSWPR